MHQIAQPLCVPITREQRDTLTTAAHVYSGYSEILHTRFSLPRVATLKIRTVIKCFILTFALESRDDIVCAWSEGEYTCLVS